MHQKDPTPYGGTYFLGREFWNLGAIPQNDCKPGQFLLAWGIQQPLGRARTHFLEDHRSSKMDSLSLCKMTGF